MLVSWLVFPLLLLALCTGSGLLVGRLTGVQLPFALVAPVGFTVILLIGELASIFPEAATLAAPISIAVAVAGLVLLRPGRHVMGAKFVAVAALAVFLVYAAPILASGEPTFAGYIKLDDTATWLALTDRIAEHGRDVANLAPSTYEATLKLNLGSGYPIGAFTPLSTASSILGRDPAWVFQPYMASMAALLAMCLYQLGGGLIRDHRLRAAAAFLAAQPALLFGYYLWGGIKEIAAAMLLALLAALLPPVVASARRNWRATVPASLAASSVFAVLTAPGAAVWLLPMLLLAAGVSLLTTGGRLTASKLGAVVGLTLLVSLPWLLDAGLLPRESGALTSPHELGNLIGPLSGWQLVGVWPTGDFRLHPSDSVATVVLIGVALLAAAIGLRQVWMRRAVGPAAFAAGLLIGAAGLAVIGSPWVGGKALATGSAAVLLLSCVGAAALWESGRRVEGGVLLALIAVGVLWSNWLAYRDVFLAPFSRLAELESVGHEIAGQGPTLMTEYEPYGVRHFLRDAEPEGASELRRRLVPLRSGGTLESGETADIDEFALEGLLTYRTFVLRRSPLASRPPLPFYLKSQGSSYEVWQTDGGPAPIKHLSLQGPGGSPVARASCAAIQKMARLPGVLHLAASVRRPPLVIPLGDLDLPPNWELGGEGAYATPDSSGTAAGTFELSSAGVYGIWIGGASRGDVAISIDARRADVSGAELDRAGEYHQLGKVRLAPGRHRIELSYSEQSALAPGAGGEAFAIGPIVLSPDTAASARIKILDPAQADSLCGRQLDWVEALPY